MKHHQNSNSNHIIIIQLLYAKDEQSQTLLAIFIPFISIDGTIMNSSNASKLSTMLKVFILNYDDKAEFNLFEIIGLPGNGISIRIFG